MVFEMSPQYSIVRMNHKVGVKKFLTNIEQHFQVF